MDTVCLRAPSLASFNIVTVCMFIPFEDNKSKSRNWQDVSLNILLNSSLFLNFMMNSCDHGTSDIKELRRRCLYVFLFALAVRAIYYIGFMDNPFFDYIHIEFDQINFDRAALGFANGSILARGGQEGFAPLYKYFLGIIYWIFGRNFHAIWAVQFVMGSSAAALLFLTASKLFNKWTALICGLFYAMYPQNLFYEGNMIRAALTECLAVILFYFLLRFKEEKHFKFAVFSGTFLSLIIQCRPNTATLLPFIIYFVYSEALKNLAVKIKVKHYLCFFGALTLVGVPLMVRTLIIHEKFVFYDASGPQTLLAGNLPEYAGVGWDIADYTEKALKMANEYGDSNAKVFGVIVKTFIESPFEYCKLYGRKIYWFFNNYEFPSNVNYYLYQNFSPVLKNPLGNFSLLAALAFVGIFLTAGKYRRLLLIYFFAAGLTLSVIIVYPTSRFRMPVVPFLMVFASHTLYYIYHMLRRRRIIQPVLCVAAMALIIFLLKTPDTYSHKIRAVDYGNLAGAYVAGSKWDASKVEEYSIKAWNQNSKINKKLLLRLDMMLKDVGKESVIDFSENPVIADNFVKILMHRASVLSKSSEYNAAISKAKNAEEVDYRNIAVHKFLNFCYLETKDYLSAINEFKQIVILEPANPENYYNLAVAYKQFNKDDKLFLIYALKAMQIDPDIVVKLNPNMKNIKFIMENELKKLAGFVQANQANIGMFFKKAKSAVESGQFEAALTVCEKIINIDYENVKARKLLANVYKRLNRRLDALSEYIDILTINPIQAEAHLELYKLYNEHEDQRVKGVFHLEKSLYLDPKQNDYDVLNSKLTTLRLWSMHIRPLSF